VAYTDASSITPRVAGIGLAIAVLSSAVPYYLEMQALRGLPQGLYGMFSSAAPAVTALAGLLILGERLNATQWLAIACIVLASATCAMSARRNK
jgi:inner membrane transporter RhtA